MKINEFISIKYIYMLKILININLYTQQTSSLNFHAINFSFLFLIFIIIIFLLYNLDNLITNTWN